MKRNIQIVFPERVQRLRQAVCQFVKMFLIPWSVGSFLESNCNARDDSSVVTRWNSYSPDIHNIFECTFEEFDAHPTHRMTHMNISAAPERPGVEPHKSLAWARGVKYLFQPPYEENDGNNNNKKARSTKTSKTQRSND